MPVRSKATPVSRPAASTPRMQSTAPSGGNSICLDGLPAALASLGQMVGLLQPGSGSGQYCLNAAWFSDPIGQTEAGFSGNGSALAELLSQLLGEVSGQAAGIPINNAALVGTWYPINNPKTGEPTGLYIGSYPDTAGNQIFGLAAYVDWEVPAAKPVLSANAWLMVPLLGIGSGGVFSVLTKGGYPITLGVAVEGSGGGPLIDTNGFSFNGVKFSANLDLGNLSNPLTLAVVVLQLQLPGETSAQDRSLASLATISSQEILNTASALFIAALSNVSTTISQSAAYFLPAIGISSIVPGNASASMPTLGWDQLLAAAAGHEGNASAPFITWFQQVAGTPANLKLWLTCIGGFLGQTAAVTGAGTLENPFAVPILSVAGKGALSFTASAVTNQQSALVFYPGLQFSSEPIALGTSSAVIQIVADAELFQFTVAAQGGSISPSSLSFSLGMTLQNATAGQPLVSSGNFQVGTLAAGLSLGSSLQPVPSLTLTDVVTPGGSFGSVDLLSPGQLAQAAATAIAAALMQLLGINPQQQQAFVDNCAALLGIQPPTLPTGVTWPAAAALQPPFAAAQIANSIQNPIEALGDYYLAVLTSTASVGGQKPFYYMVQELAGLLQDASQSTLSITGAGTQESPWAATISVTQATLPAALTVYSTTTGGVTDLVFGLALEPQLKVGKVNVVLAFDIDFMTLTLPSSGAGFSASWLPNVNLGLYLPDGYQSGTVGGVSVSLTSSSLSAGWAREGGWYWSLVAGSPTITIAGTPVALGQDLDFGNQTSLESLVTNEVPAFVNMLAGVLGAALIGTGTRPALALAGVLGLLKDISQAPNFPSGLQWPNGMPTLALTGFTDPRPALLGQIANDFSTQQNGAAVLSLLAWAMNSGLTAAPAIPGEGTFASPYLVPCTAGFSLLVWYTASGQTIGLGLGRTTTIAVGNIYEFTAQLSLQAIEVSLATGKVQTAANTPSLSITTELSSTQGMLIPGSAQTGSLGKVEVGCTVSFIGGAFQFAPVVNLLDVTLPGQSQQAVLSLTDYNGPNFTVTLQQAFVSLLNTALFGNAAVTGSTAFQTAYGLLADLGLVLPQAAKTDPLGINPAGWQALLADPLTFAGSQFTSLLANPTQRASFFAYLQQITGIQLPTIPTPVLDVLGALGFVGDAAHGYPLLPEQLLALAQSPFSTLGTAFKALIEDPARMSALATALAGNIPPTAFGPFTFQSSGGNQISLGIEAKNAVTLAGLLSFSGQISLNLSNFVLTASTDLFSPQVGLGVNSMLTYQTTGGGAPAFEVAVNFGNGALPSAPPIAIYPFQSTQFVQQLAAIAPAYVLSTVGTMALENTLLQDYLLVQRIFSGLGLATQRADGTWTMPSLVGLLYDPLGWLLSDEVLGENGHFSLTAFGTLLSKIPKATASNGVSVAPITGGIQVSGLPYNFGLSFSATATMASIGLTTSNFTIASGKGTLQKLSAAITLAAHGQPGFAGDVQLATAGLTPAFYVDAGYTQTAAAAGFSLTVGAGTQGSSGIFFQLLPFQGFGSLLNQALQQLPAAVVNQVIPKVLQALQAAGAGTFVAALQKAGSDLQTAALASTITALPSPITAAAIEDAALTWLLARFNAANMAGTASAVATLLQTVLPTEVSSTGGLITYSPKLNQLPVTLLAGVNSQNLVGIWIELQLNLPQVSALSIGLQPTGVGVPMTGSPTPQFSFAIDLTVPVEDTVGPQLNLSYNAAQGIELTFDPMGDAANAANASKLSTELLPQFFGNPSNLEQAFKDWLIGVITQVLPRYIAAVVLKQASVLTWLNAPMVTGGPTPGTVLVASSLLQQSGGGDYSLTPLSDLLAMSPTQFLGNLLQALLKTELQLIRFAAGGGITIGPDPNNASSYGILLAAPNLKVPKLDNVVLQLGAADDAWIKNAGGSIGSLQPGISFYVPINGSAGNFQPDFGAFDLNLVNVGMDFVGSGSAPLVNLSRFQLGAVEPRTLLTVDMQSGSPNVSFGAGLTLADIAISVAPNTLVQGSGGNAVASNLLGSGSDSKQNNPPTNPKFNVQAAYINNLWVNLSSGTTNGNQIILPVQRTFGPLDVNSVGLGWQQSDKVLQLLFDGSVALGGLEASVDQLTVGIPVTTLTDFSKYTLDLQGLNVSFNNGTVAISGGFLKTENPLSYTGAALIKAANFSLVAVGSYAVLDGAPSMFIFGALLMPLGGPPAFFITGIAAGFAFNRSLKLPGISGVQDFPLVSGVTNGSFQQGQSPDSALTVLNEVIAPEIGQYWLAAGLKFTSFGLLDSFALLFIEFGNTLSIYLLGLTSAPIPKGPLQLAYIELAIKVAIQITEGIISAEAQLTPNSYVIAKDCKLTGGFAFYLWFKNIQTTDYSIPAGSFVVTLGGYHPAFQAPAYYPTVPRLGFSWLIDAGVGTVKVGGGAYFAICSTAVMAGGYLNVTFTAGPLNAWFDASADFLVQWQPFFYVVDIGVSVGAGFKTTVLGVDVTLSVELGATLHLEGPPTHGYVHVSWFVISFTIPFGDGNPPGKNVLTWKQFENSFLPPEASNPSSKWTHSSTMAAPHALLAGVPGASLVRAATAPTAPSGTPVQQVVKFNVQDGLLNQTETECLVRAVPFSVQALSAIPTTSLTLDNWSGQPLSGPAVGVRPMALITLDSPITFTITNTETGQVATFGPGVALTQVLNGAPGALWSQQALDLNQPPDPSTMLIEGALMGAVFETNAYITFNKFGSFPLSNLAYTMGTPVLIPYANTPNVPPAVRFTTAQQQQALLILQQSIMAPTVIQTRNAMFAALRASGMDAPANPSLAVMAAAAYLILQRPPVLARPAIYQTGTTTVQSAAKVVRLAQTDSVAAKAPSVEAPEMVGILRQYKINAPVAKLHAGLPAYSSAVSGQWSGPRRSTEVQLKANASNGVRIAPGIVTLWKLDARSRYTAEVTGAAAMRVVCFDKNGEILSDQAGTGARAFSPGSGAVALCGVPEAGGHILAAWQMESHLARINHYYGVGDGCTVRTQNVLQQRRHGRSVTQGPISACDLIANNQVQDVSGLKPGWIETIFPVTGLSARSFAVAVGTAEGAAPEVRVTMAPGDTPGLTSQDELTPDAVFSTGGATVLVFSIPAGSHAYVNVIAQPLLATSTVLGVYLLDLEASAVEQAWPELTLTHNAPPAGQVAPFVHAVVRAGKLEASHG